MGAQEAGKKSLLYRICVEYIDDFDVYNKIPVFIDFLELKNKNFITVIKEYTRLNTNAVKLLLEKGRFIILIDNLNYHESKGLDYQINRFHEFNKEYSKNRIIATYEYDGVDILPREIVTHCKIAFSYHYIRELRTREIKQIMNQWLPSDDTLKNEEKLEKLVNTFTSYHLPSNALSVHLYLWSVENSDRKPINQAVLMEIYIEIILEKLGKGNIYRSNFDFVNKIQLISMVAEKIIKKNTNNTLSFIEFTEIVTEYIQEEVGFDFDVRIIINYLLDRKIFIKSKNEIRFSYLCFQHFFIAKRMQNNSSFKSYILDESRYFNFPKEIDYYTGLVRSDKETFLIIYNRFKDIFEPMSFILEEVNPDEYFNINLKKEVPVEKEPIARTIQIAEIKDSRPTDSQIEKQFDEQLNKISKWSNELGKIDKIDFDRMMLIMCNTLRNSEGIEDLDLKKEAYNNVIKHNLTYSILYTQVLIRYIINNQSLPPSIPQGVSLEALLENIPYHIQLALNTHLGTQKLSKAILNKMIIDKTNRTNSEIEKFLSVTLYSDVFGNDFVNHLKKFIKSSKTVPVQNYLLYKLTDYLYKRARPNSTNEEMYLDLISDLQIRSQKLPKRLKESIKKEFKEQKERMNRFIGLD